MSTGEQGEWVQKTVRLGKPHLPLSWFSQGCRTKTQPQTWMLMVWCCYAFLEALRGPWVVTDNIFGWWIGNSNLPSHSFTLLFWVSVPNFLLRPKMSSVLDLVRNLTHHHFFLICYICLWTRLVFQLLGPWELLRDTIWLNIFLWSEVWPQESNTEIWQID